MKARPPHLRIKRLAVREWEVRVVVADGGWRIATTGTAAEALELALEKIAERHVRSVEVVEVTA